MGQEENNADQAVDRQQIVWGAIVGVITVGLMAVSYYVGIKRGEEKEDVLGEESVQEIQEREVYIAVRSDCSDYEETSKVKDGKEVRKYCVNYQEESAFAVMKRLVDEDTEFSFDYDESDFGAFITSINNYHPDIASRFWAFLVNGEVSLVGVSDYMVIDGDELGFRVEEVEL